MLPLFGFGVAYDGLMSARGSRANDYGDIWSSRPKPSMCLYLRRHHVVHTLALRLVTTGRGAFLEKVVQPRIKPETAKHDGWAALDYNQFRFLSSATPRTPCPVLVARALQRCRSQCRLYHTHGAAPAIQRWSRATRDLCSCEKPALLGFTPLWSDRRPRSTHAR